MRSGKLWTQESVSQKVGDSGDFRSRRGNVGHVLKVNSLIKSNIEGYTDEDNWEVGFV